MFKDQEEAFKAVKSSSSKATELARTSLDLAAKVRHHKLSEWYLPSDASVSMLSILIEAASAAKFAGSVTKSRASHMPASRLIELNNNVSSLSEALERFVSMATDLSNDNRPLKFYRTGVVEGQLTGERYYDFGVVITDIYHRIDGVRNSPALIGIVVNDAAAERRYEQSISEVARKAKSTSEEISELLNAASAQSKEIEENLDSVKKSSAELSVSWDQKQELLSEIESSLVATKEEAENHKASISSAMDDINKLRDELVETSSAAHSSATEIEKFHADLENVRSELERIELEARKGEDSHKVLINKVSDLVAEAEAMVSGATTAGLAKAFDEERRRLSKSMSWALFSFFVGIAFLFLTTILLAAYVFEIPIELFGYNVGQNGVTPERGDEITLAGVLSRTVILTAPFWLTLFSSRRYRNLFDLRQQYTHKYSMAFSVDGFKQQAPTYSEQMAAWVFQVVSEAPVSTKSSKGLGGSPIPDIRAVVDPHLERFGNLMPNRATE